MDVIILSEYLPGGTMMKFLLAITIGLTIGVLVTTAVETRAVSYIDHDQVGLKLAKGGTMVSTPTYIVLGSHRDKEGQVEVHDKETDVFYVTDGQATFLTGGTMIGGKQTSPNQSLGTDMKGGQSHSLSKGDVIVIPAGTPHWFKNVPDHINYFVVKVIQP
jgi:mannose-6-phosphate isomerase-like protein (cupin superfamily)